MYEQLNVNHVDKLIKRNGLKQSWLIHELKMKETMGRLLLKGGLLPKDPDTRKELLSQLAALLRTSVKDITVQIKERE